MATPVCQKLRTEAWSSIFPTSQVTEQQSALFVKKLLAVSVSSIAYLRALFPEHAFGDRSLEDITLKILRDDSACEGACQVINWVKGAFDALEKKYLRQVLIGIYEDADDPDTVVEQYMFKFQYNDKESLDIYRNGRKILTTETETKKATIKLLRTIIMLSQTLAALPDDVMMTMKLLYYDDVTPADYQPPGFKDCENDAFQFNGESMNIKVGDVDAPHHSFKLRIKTGYHQLQYKEDDEEMQVETALPVIHEKEEEEGSSREEFKAIEGDRVDSILDSPNVPGKLETAGRADVIATQSQDQLTQASLVVVKQVARCCCGVNEDDGLMILCEFCDTWQHALCFGITEATSAPEKHACVDCVKSRPGEHSTDPSLESLEEIELQDTCLWRRALYAVVESPRVLAQVLAKRLGVETYIASQLVKRLESEGYVKTTAKGKRLGKVVLKEKVKTIAIPKYFASCKRNINDQQMSEDVEEARAVKDMIENASKLHIAPTPKIASESKLDVGSTSPVSQVATPRRGRKRAVSQVNKENEFEISDSQDQERIGSQSFKRRRKSSIASKSILV